MHCAKLRLEISDFINGCVPSSFEDVISRCEAFRLILSEENTRHNLTSIKDEDSYWIKHICDSLALLRFHPEILKSAMIADFGTGAGFPAVPLAIALPQAKITAFDSTRKKIAFIERAAGICEIRNLRPVWGRAAELSEKPEFRKSFEIVTARAVGTGAEIFSGCRKMLKTGGRIILYKTPASAEREICEIRRTTSSCGVKWTVGESFDLPMGAGSRCFITGQMP